MTSLEAAPRSPAVPATGNADLWCTYAAVRTMAWLARTDRIPAAARTAEYVLGCRNTDGGFAWSKGMLSDAWATFYCAATLSDLGVPLPNPDETVGWLGRTWSGDAYAMLPGQDPEIWATHFSTRTAIELCGVDVPDRSRLLTWLGSLQTADGGLSWSPDHASAGNADVRACYYGVATWRALNSIDATPPPWDVPALIGWLQARQAADGGFRFDGQADVSCMWATYRAVGALVALGAAPARPCVEWILGQRDPSGAFTRWPGYPVPDVWASFCAVGALAALGALTTDVADAVDRRIAELACPAGGFTYREPEHAADALATAAAALTADPGDPALPALVDWLEGCQLPNEGGVMYMPGRGAEVRCTAWAMAAGAFRTDPAAIRRIASWLGELQNPDGGFGYWHGRGSDLVSTAAAVEICRFTAPVTSTTLNRKSLARFVARCRHDGAAGYGNVPGAPDTLRSGLQAARVLAFVGHEDRALVSDLLDRHRVRGGGWANQGSRMPDLLSTYEAVVTADRHGLRVDRDHVTRFLDRTATASGIAWSPLAPGGGDPLARCLHLLLRRRLRDPLSDLPALTLS